MNYREIAKSIINMIGGSSNVNSMTHCVTRLRFVLNDDTLPNTESIKKLNGVMGVVKQGGQYQVIIGNEVDYVYQEVNNLLDLKETETINEKKKSNLWDKFTSTVSGIFTPFLGVFAACGILKGLLTASLVLGLLNTEMGVYIVLNAISDSIYYFFPIILGATSAERFGMNKYLGMIIGGTMIYPSIISAADIENFTFLHIPMGAANYTSTVFPAIITVYAASLLYKLLKKICPKVLQFFLLPLITMIIIVPLALIVIGPVLNETSAVILVIMNGVYNFSPILCAILLGGPWLILVMFGLHWAFIPLFLNQIMTAGSCPMMGLLCSNQFAVSGAMLAVAARSKLDREFKSLGISTGVTAILGVSEPGIYGVLLPLKKPFILAILAGSLGAIPAAIMGTKIFAFGGAGIFSLPGCINPAGIDSAFYGSIISAALGLTLGYLLTYFFGIPKKEEL